MKAPRSIVHCPARAAFAAAWRRVAQSARLRGAPLLGAIALLLTMSLLSACNPVTPLTETDLAHIAQESKVIALFRLDLRAPDGRSLKPFEEKFDELPFQVRLGDLETGGKPHPRRVLLRSPSQELGDAGWVSLILSPGRHYLYLNKRFSGVGVFSYDASWASAPRWIVDIPSDARVVYLGTVKMRATMAKGLFSGPDDIESVALDSLVANEEGVARAIVAQHLSSLGPVKTALMPVHATNTFEF